MVHGLILEFVKVTT